MNDVIVPEAQATVLKAFMILLVLFLLWWKRHLWKEVYLEWKGENRFALLLMAPAFLAIFSVIVFPFFYNVAISFSNLSLKTFGNWQIVGIHHYIDVLTDSKFYSVFLKTFIWTAGNLVFHVGIGVFLAVVINQTLPARPLFRTILIIPWAVPQYITALTWRGMFNQEYGAINIALAKFFNMDPVQWLSDPVTAFSACILTNVWLGFPFMMIVALGGLQAIPSSYYEAARVDGAGAWQRFRRITLPLLWPTMTPAIILGTIWTFNNLHVLWLVSNGGEPANQTHILVSYVYKAAFNLYRYGYGAALSMIIFLILLIFGIFMLRRPAAV